MFLFHLFYRMLLGGTDFGETHSSRCHFENKSSTNSWLSSWVCPTSSSYFSALFLPPTVPHTHWNMCSSDLIAGSDYTILQYRKKYNFSQTILPRRSFYETKYTICLRLTGCLNSVAGTTRGSPSRSQISATPASRNTKSPQFPTPHSTTHKSSKSMGKCYSPSPFFVSQLQLSAPILPSFLRWRCTNICLLCVELQQPTVFTWQHVSSYSLSLRV